MICVVSIHIISLIIILHRRIVNVSSGAASAYIKGSFGKNPIGKLELKDKSALLSFDCTWKDVVDHIDKVSSS